MSDSNIFPGPVISEEIVGSVAAVGVVGRFDG
jgi:hypothetical protein